MSKFLINGGKKLKGKIHIYGNKNSILPCIAAALLTQEPVTLRNVPKIYDVEVLLKIMEYLGATVEIGDHSVKITCNQIKTVCLPEELVAKLRGSILLVGPLLARCGRVEFFHPGGDVIGKRSIETHIEGLTELGFGFNNDDRFYKGYIRRKNNTNREVFLDEASSTATENLIMASALFPGTTTLKNCAREPQIVDLCKMLIGMGVEIEGYGNSTIVIKGKNHLTGTEFTIISDYIELGTYAVAAALTKGELEAGGEGFANLEPVTKYLGKMGVLFKYISDKQIMVSAKSLTAMPKLHTNIWPGFPTDMMSTAIVLATQARGISLMHDWMYESRMYFVDKLQSMGANITVADPHRVFIYGPNKLYGRNLETPDIRAGMALVLAALVAHGTSTINRAELIERGYEDVVGKLQSLGADIQRIDS